MSAPREVSVVLLPVGEPARVVRIPNTLEALQGLVGGYIEDVGALRPRLVVLGNEDGIALGLPARVVRLRGMREGTFRYVELRGALVVNRVDSEGDMVDVTEVDVRHARGCVMF